MGQLQNHNNLISHLSIPGTHDSCSNISLPYVQTQTLNITQQLNAGIRFLDFRANFNDNVQPYVLWMVHGPYKLAIRMEEALQMVYSFLSHHPTEGVIIQVKHDWILPDGMTPADFAASVFALINQNGHMWRLEATIPRIFEIQGRIQLIRRFDHAGQLPIDQAGLDVTLWDRIGGWDSFTIPAIPRAIRGQDHFEYAYADGDSNTTIGKKFKLVQSLMIEAASQSDPDMWYFNYATAYRKPFTIAALTPWEFAQGVYNPYGRYIDGVNIRVNRLISASAPTRYGVIMLDFPTDSHSAGLVQKIIQTNIFQERGPGYHIKLRIH